MKRAQIIIGVLILALLAGAGTLLACSNCKRTHEHGGKKEEKGAISHYTCPMHPQIHEDRPGECPICHMDLVPVYKEGGAQEGQGDRPAAPIGVLISPERQQLIGLKTAEVVKRPAVKEIRTVGRVAYDPDLAVAQREYIEISKNVPSLKAAATSRLKLLGMSDEEIRSLEKKGKVSSNLYLPDAGDSVWIYATLYQEELGSVKSGLEADISLPSGGGTRFTGTVRAIDPTLNPTTRSARARIEVPGAGGSLRPDTYVNVTLKIDLGEMITVPQSALIDTGTRKVAFVVHDDRHFEPRNLETGPAVGEDVVVLKGLQEGERVVASATFLVDSESQLKAAIAGMGEHQH